MKVLYTALLGLLVSAIITFVRRKLKVKEDTNAESIEEKKIKL